MHRSRKIPQSVGIEYINFYGSSMSLSHHDLATARGRDPHQIMNDFFLKYRSLNPLFEDAITMGVNAAYPIMRFVDPSEIGLLVVGTETSLDFGKSISTNIHGALNLGPHVRNFETKLACYSGVAALQVAVDWVASGAANGRKALVIASDHSRAAGLYGREEFVLGGVASAIVISDTPAILEYELGKMGSWTNNVYDTFRPTATKEMGNNEVSLYSYIDALEGAYGDYCNAAQEPVDYQQYFPYFVFHTPFPAMAFQAHRILFNLKESHPKQQVKADFDTRVFPAIQYAQRLGSTYSSSNFVGLCSLVNTNPDIAAGTRVGFYAYGSGAIGECYSGLIGEQAAQRIGAMQIDDQLASRRKVTVEEYETIEKEREKNAESANFTPDHSYPSNLYADNYENKHKYVLVKVEDYYRYYEWS